MTGAASHLRERASAKINLALHVTGKRADGYHLLDSLVAFADVGDALEVGFAAQTSLTITGPFAHKLKAGDEENIVLRAIAGLRGLLPELPPVQVTLEKHLPVSSGLGGGSADAAAVLRALVKLVPGRVDAASLHQLALSLGSDVPVCLFGQSCRMQGIGDVITPLPLGPYAAVLANPGLPCDTADVFARLGLREGFAPIAEPLQLSASRNDLEAPAIRAVPVIADVLAGLRACEGVELARMSGSGATCFGLFASHAQADAAAKSLQQAHPHWWVKAVTIG